MEREKERKKKNMVREREKERRRRTWREKRLTKLLAAVFPTISFRDSLE